MNQQNEEEEEKEEEEEEEVKEVEAEEHDDKEYVFTRMWITTRGGRTSMDKKNVLYCK